jgi:hypothetical protein
MLAVTLWMAALLGQVGPYEAAEPVTANGTIDALVLSKLATEGVEPAPLCSDAVFVRRVFFDVIGTLPEPQEVTSFLEDTRPNKRALLIESLLQRPEFADYWAMKWSDALRIKSEFPINLWPNAAQSYHRWVRDAIRDNMPYDRFARTLLTSSGSNFREPPVNFYRAVQGRDPMALAGAVALTFMGTRLDKWPKDKREAMAAFFSRIAYKQTDEWKEEIVCLDPAPAEALKATLPDGTAVTVEPDRDPREVFADWLVTPENPWFARSVANRVWAWLMGRGVVQEPDDIREDNPPSDPALLDCLTKAVVDSKFDLRQLYRLILNSRTYQQSSIPRGDNPKAEALFAYYPVRRMEAEVLIDALDRIADKGEEYSSAVPEPYTYIPSYMRTIALEDGSVTSAFLQMFGRPTRDSGMESERINQPSDAQRLHLLNSTEVQKKIANSGRVRGLVKQMRGDAPQIVRWLYLGILSRYPTEAEQQAAVGYFKSAGLPPQKATEDVAWALVNSKEFLYRH